MCIEAELVRSDPELACRHHIRASEWFESMGDIDNALRHALGADDLARADALVTEHTGRFHTTGRYATVARRLASFPEGYVTSSPSLCLMAGVTALGMGDGAGATTWVRFGDHAQATSPHPDTSTGFRLDAFRSLISSTSVGDALDDAQRAYHGLPPGFWHAAATMTHGALSFALGDDEVALAMFLEGHRGADRRSNDPGGALWRALGGDPRLGR